MASDTEVDSLLRSVEQSMTGEGKESIFGVGDGDNVIRVRGLPWSTKEKDVREFFSLCDNIMAIHFTYSREGRPTGEAYIELGSQEDVERALTKNRELLGQRYIEVFVSKKDEMEFVLKRSGRRPGLMNSSSAGSASPGGFGGSDGGGATPDPETVVRLRGLPFGCTKEDITTFFEGLEIAPDGIVFAAQQQFVSPHYGPGPQPGRRSKPGEAYVRFINKEMAELALDRHMNKIGHRYIEVFRSTVDEMDRHCGQPGKMIGAYGKSGTRPGPYSTGGGPVPLFSIAFPDAPPGVSMGRGWNDGSAYGHTGGAGRGYGGPGGGTGQEFYGGYPGGDGFYGTQAGYYTGDPSAYSARSNAHLVRMRGLPFKATANDIMEFFVPLKLVNVQMKYDERTGRPSGEAEVELFSHEDALEAMKKDRQDMGGRYIELFLNSRQGPPATATPYGTVPAIPQNGTGTIAPTAGDQQAGAMGAFAAQPLVQYPGFGSYDYGRSDTAGVPAQQAPPPPPPTGPGTDPATGGTVYY